MRHWAFDIALPFWADRGVDRQNGGYVEMLDATGAASAPYKRTRVLCRQIYVFSHATALGWSEGLTAAEHGYRFLVDKARLSAGAWARQLTFAGDVTDGTPDLYDVAFVLFALGWYSRATGETEPLRLAHETLNVLEATFRQPTGGFAHELPMAGWRVQNPHMHMLEAALSLHEAAPGDGRFLALADEIVSLFETRFYRRDSGALTEYFDHHWRPAPGAPGRIVEPGHQFESAWILSNHQRLTGRDNTDLANGLHHFAETHGVDASSHVTYNAVDVEGAPLDQGSRTWPNTERIKGAIALYELTGRDPRSAVTESTNLLLRRYLDGQGTWIDHFDAQGTPSVNIVPASTLYHAFLAFTEVLRVAPKLGL